MNYAVILAGGIGERLWPKSRTTMPKHLQPIVGDKTMFQQTVDRIRGLVDMDRVYVVTSREQKDIILSQVSDIVPDQVIAEPFGRNTAAAIGVAAAIIHARDPEAVMMSLHSDHHIKNVQAFQKVLGDCCTAAKASGALATIGITPTYPNTGYGYIHRMFRLSFPLETVFHQVGSFKEKPDAETAREYMSSGEYYWNSGMFIWTTSVILEEINRNMPTLGQGCEKIAKAFGTPEFDKTMKDVYECLESIPIDTGIMERAENVIMAESTFDWDDVGSWVSIEAHVEKDPQGNAVQGNFVSIDSTGCIVSGDASLITAIGISDLIIVKTGDAVLICPKDRAQDVKELVRKLKSDPNLEKHT